MLEARKRPQLFTPEMQANLLNQGYVVFGCLCVLLGGALIAILTSYSPQDPNWISPMPRETDNILGLIGAVIASVLIFGLGYASFALAYILMLGGIRLIIHRLFLPLKARYASMIVFLGLAIIFAATLNVHSSWMHSFGLGGQLGDIILENILKNTPLEPAYALTIISPSLFAVVLFLGIYVMGLRWNAIKKFLYLAWDGFWLSYWFFSILIYKTVKYTSIFIYKITLYLLHSLRLQTDKDETPPTQKFSLLKPTAKNDTASLNLDIKSDENSVEHRNDDYENNVPKIIFKPRQNHNPHSQQAKREQQPAFNFSSQKAQNDILPPLSLLTDAIAIERPQLSSDALLENAHMLEGVLEDYGIKGNIPSVHPGPVVTLYELEPTAGLKASRVIGLADDIARSMSAASARVSTIPERTAIGIELPNTQRETVFLREILSHRSFGDARYPLPLALGKTIDGTPHVVNLAKMPHLLIAGTTGSGKSVAINTMILSLLYKLSPNECRLIMIDPKMLELSVYDGIPHLLTPVVTDPKKAVLALKWAVTEMEKRYHNMSKMGVRNIESYNARIKSSLAKGEIITRKIQTGFDDETGEPLYETQEFAPETVPYIVVVVDEMADLMMVAGKEIEACIQRLAQMARASGIHIIMATQRPSVDVITGTIKANFPSRISFQVTTRIDSRTILGEIGAEQLLGMGDMLYMESGKRLKRIHGPFCSDEDVEKITTYLKQFGKPDYLHHITESKSSEHEKDANDLLGFGGNTNSDDALYDQAVAIVIKDRKCSTSYIQRKLSIGYNKAAKLVEKMEENNLISAANHVGKRDILVPEQ